MSYSKICVMLESPKNLEFEDEPTQKKRITVFVKKRKKDD